MISVEYFAQILRRNFCDAVNVSRNGSDVFRHPRRGIPGWRRERAAECAGGAGENKRANPGKHGLFKEIERARNVGINKTMRTVSDDMGFVQGCRMEHSVNPCHAFLDEVAVNYGPDLIGEI